MTTNMAAKGATAAPKPGQTKEVEFEDELMQDVEARGSLEDEDEDSDEPNGDFESDLEYEDAVDADLDILDPNVSGEDGVFVQTGRAMSPSALPSLPSADAETVEISMSAADNAEGPLNPQRPTPYIYDPGNLLISDPNPLPRSTSAQYEVDLAANARDATQALLNHLLTACPIHKANNASTLSSGVTMILPAPTFALPREKKIPQPKPPTKWEQFAARKGIGRNNRKPDTTVNGELRSTEGSKVYDEASGEWVRRWGFKGRNKKGEGEWLVEVDEKKEREAGEAGDARSDNRASRKERMRRNERAQRANERRARKGNSGMS